LSDTVHDVPGALEQEFAPELGAPEPSLERPPRDSRLGTWTAGRIVWSLLGIAFLVWAIWAFVDDGTTFVSLVGSSVAEGAVITLSALGFVVILKATGIANFAQGDLITLGAFLGFWATDHTAGLGGVHAVDGLHLSLGLGYIVVLVLMFFIGVVVERVACAPLRGREVHVVVIATLGAALIIRTLLSLWQGGDYRSLRSWFNPGQPLQNFGPFNAGVFKFSIGFLGVHDAVISAHRVFVIFVTAIVIVAMMLLFSRTSFGRQVRAIAADRETARMYGVKASRLSMLSFGMAAVLAGLAGLMIGPLAGMDLTVGFTYMLLAFAAVTLGGFTSIPGILAGGMMIGFTEHLFGEQMLPMVAGHWTQRFTTALPYLLMIVVIAVRPQGLFGRVGGRL
jgi:branched-chain amino acid transport system permease protein